MRLLFIYLLIFSYLFANIKENYCVNKRDIEANLFKRDIKDNFIILKLPKNRLSYSVPSLKIIKKFKEHNISIEDNSKGVVKFRLNCNENSRYKRERALLKKIFIKRYGDNIEIKKININSTRSLKTDGYELVNIILKDSNLRHNFGTVLAIYKKGDTEKRVYLKYKIDGYIYLLKAMKDLQKGSLVKDGDYAMIKMKFTKIPSHAIIGDLKKAYLTKNRIRKDSILTYNHFKIKKEFQKGSYIKAILEDGALVLEIDAKVMSDADREEIVKIRTNAGKIFRAKILPNGTAKILE